jgi:hypothetical protein
MNKLSRALVVTLMAATVPATIVLAQQPTPADQQPAADKIETRRGPTPETLARLEDGRIAMAKAALKLSPDQEKLWGPVEANMRASFEERRKAREAWAAKRDERRAAKSENADGDKKAELALPDRIEKRSERLTKQAVKLNERAAKVKGFAEVLKPLYASFSEEQKAVAGRVLTHFGQDGRGPRGPRWAMGGGGKRGHGGPDRD